MPVPDDESRSPALKTEPEPAPPRSPRLARSRHPGLAIALRALLTVVAMLAASLGSALAAHALGARLNLTGQSLRLTVYTVVCLVGCLLAWLLRRFFEQDRHGYLAAGWQRGRAVAALGAGTLAAVVALGTAYLVATAAGTVGWSPSELTPSELLAGLPLILGVSFGLQGIPEEMLWRGYFQTTAAERVSPVTAAVVGAAVFGSMHLVSIGSGDTVVSKLVYIAAACGLGLACAGLRLVTGSVWAAAGFHGGMHVVVRVAGVWATREQEVQLNALTGACELVTGLICLALWRRRQSRAQVR
ncbi:MAG: CPBP family intramembrane metalloprotease [Actinomycetia bacterium]|nr:CPBP family intramembrane metalloprotease [Actinomycetes bacterium]